MAARVAAAAAEVDLLTVRNTGAAFCLVAGLVAGLAAGLAAEGLAAEDLAAEVLAAADLAAEVLDALGATTTGSTEITALDPPRERTRGVLGSVEGVRAVVELTSPNERAAGERASVANLDANGDPERDAVADCEVVFVREFLDIRSAP